MIQKTIHFVALFLTMLVTGLFWGTWFALSRTIDTFSIAEFIHIGKTIISNVANPMKIILPGCILFMAIALWKYPIKKSVSFYLIVTSFTLLVVTLIITVGVEVPIDNQINTWTPENPPANWSALRDRWELYHTIRTFTSIASFGCLTAALLK